jgi:hypothetical protein
MEGSSDPAVILLADDDVANQAVTGLSIKKRAIGPNAAAHPCGVPGANTVVRKSLSPADPDTGAAIK